MSRVISPVRKFMPRTDDLHRDRIVRLHIYNLRLEGVSLLRADMTQQEDDGHHHHLQQGRHQWRGLRWWEGGPVFILTSGDEW